MIRKRGTGFDQTDKLELAWLQAKDRLSKSNAAFRFHDSLNKIADIFLAVPIFSCVGNVICLYKDLPIQTVYFMKSMMMPHKKSYSVNLCLRHSGTGKKRFDQRNSFLFLMFPVCVSIFLTAKRACNVMCNCGYFQNVLSFRIDLFQFSDSFCIIPNSNEVINIMNIAIRESNHFFHYL